MSNIQRWSVLHQTESAGSNLSETCVSLSMFSQVSRATEASQAWPQNISKVVPRCASQSKQIPTGKELQRCSCPIMSIDVHCLNR